MKKIIFFLLMSFQINAQTAFQKADSLLVLGDYQKALTILEKDTISFNSLNKSGVIYQQIGNYTKAIEKYNKALAIRFNLKTKENLGKCYQKNNRTAKAILLFEEVLKENNNNLLLKYHLAKLYKSKRAFLKAKTHFKELINSDNKNPNYYYYLGSTYRNLKEKDSAKSAFLKAIDLDSTHFKSLYKLSKIFRKESKYTSKKLPKKFRDLYQEKNDTSYYYLKKGLQFYPNSKALLQLATKYYFKDEDYSKTIEYSSQLKYLSAEEQQNLAISYFFIKDYKQVKDYLYDLIDTQKATTQTFYYLALTYKVEKDYEKAELYMNFAIRVEQPQLAPYYFELGLIHQEAKQYPKAINNFKTALEEDQYHYKSHYHLALLSDSYYKDKKIALKLYESYLNKFTYQDKEITAFVKQRMKELKIMLFNKG
jgi:tetratricopeptide (TPR) repeat protein